MKIIFIEKYFCVSLSVCVYSIQFYALAFYYTLYALNHSLGGSNCQFTATGVLFVLLLLFIACYDSVDDEG